jgi:outer membrane protein
MRTLTVWLYLIPALTALGADAPAPDQPVIGLSMKQAVELALSPNGNAKVKQANETAIQAKGRANEARSILLPDFEGQIGLQNQDIDLGQIGADAIKFGVHINVPTLAGPYTAVNFRAFVTQAVFDYGSFRRWQAARTAAQASQADRDYAEDQVRTLVAKAYVQALRMDADLEAAHADLELAQALHRQAEDQKETGQGTGIDVTRSDVQLADSQQRILAVENNKRTAYLQLLQATGMSLDSNIQLTDKLSYEPMEPITLADARTTALKNRSDWKAQKENEKATDLNTSSVKAQRLPTIYAAGNYGTSGQVGDPLFPTRSYGLLLHLPFYNGGRTEATRMEANSQSRQQHVRSNEMLQQIEVDLRVALDTIQTAQSQIQVASRALTQATSELAQARRRNSAGVADGIEVTDAQTRLEHARDSQIAALFAYNVARIDLGQAMGTVRGVVQ